MFEHISLPTILISYVALLFSLSVHEACHATAAYLLDDDTAARMGRMTLNPVAHVDVLGTVVFPLAGLLFGGFFIGWAKPVPWDPGRITRKVRLKVAGALISLAGPVSNLILALVFVILTALAARFLGGDLLDRRHLWNLAFAGPQALVESGLEPTKVLLLGLGGELVQLNILLAAFNIIPLGPLDGAGVLGGVLPDHLQYSYNRWRYHPYTWIALFALMYLGVLRFLLAPTYYLAGLVLNPVAHFVLGV